MSRSLLVLDSEVLAQREDFLWGFAQRGAFGLIAILYAHDAANIPLSAPLPGAIVLHYPVDDDSWLLMMHQLLDLAN